MRRFSIVITLMLLFSAVWASAYGDEDAPAIPPVSIPEATNFSVDGRQAAAEDRMIMLLISQVHCPYCMLIKEEIIHPMIRGKDYADRLLIRELFIDMEGIINDFDGKPVDAAAFAHQHGARLTPTLLFLDAKGNELTERMIGINTPEMYFYYVDQSIRKALSAMRN